MDNLQLWNKVRQVPLEAQKTIGGGRLRGMTDINPVYRIQTLTAQFGPAGFGWRYEITDKRLEPGANGEIAAFVDINLYVNDPAMGWSQSIPGTGGAMFVANEKNGAYTSDECYKMALTDAISVACKALGIGADVYWSQGASKYPTQEAAPEPKAEPRQEPKQEPKSEPRISPQQLAQLQRECANPDGTKNQVEADRLKQTYTNHGYTDAKSILAKDFDQIWKEFVEGALPFNV
jgi:hypothetical protein